MRADFAVALLSLTASSALAQSRYRLAESMVGYDFLKAFTWETFDDPTHGRVNYIDQETAIEKNLSFATDSKFFMSANSCDVVPPEARGRDSIRIKSYSAWDEFLLVLDLEHMPEGCGTWPAFWTLSKAGPWPRGGEIDIIEGVNLQNVNQATLHTLPGCTMSDRRWQSGTAVATDCDTSVDYNQGCGTAFDSPSYGTSLNAKAGGWYVMRKSREQGVSVWFWARDDPSVPYDVRDSTGEVWPRAEWGLPDADFPTNDCEYDQHFDAHQLVFDLTFCGDWAGATYPMSGCPGTCEDYVNNNPKAFATAYWEINSLDVYTPL